MVHGHRDPQVLFGFGEKVAELKKNVEEVASKKDDAAERVVAESPGKTQEDNAEKVRREAGECCVTCFLTASQI